MPKDQGQSRKNLSHFKVSLTAWAADHRQRHQCHRLPLVAMTPVRLQAQGCQALKAMGLGVSLYVMGYIDTL